jgi:putative ATP-binding cassette transporter
MNDLGVWLPDGTPLVDVDGLHFPSGQNVLVSGPSGSGKSTLFRAIAGVWPFGTGRISVQQGARVMLLPQRPYLPVGSDVGSLTNFAKRRWLLPRSHHRRKHRVR